MQSSRYSVEDFTLPQGPDVYAEMGKLIISWGRLDALVTNWLANELHLDKISTFLLIGKADTRLKFDKLRLIYREHHATDDAAFLKRFSGRIQELADYRNNLCHCFFVGEKDGFLMFIDMSRPNLGTDMFDNWATSRSELAAHRHRINDAYSELLTFLIAKGFLEAAPPS